MLLSTSKAAPVKQERPFRMTFLSPVIPVDIQIRIKSSHDPQLRLL